MTLLPISARINATSCRLIIESVVSLLGENARYARDEGSFASFVDFYHSRDNSPDTDFLSFIGQADGFSYANADNHDFFGRLCDVSD